jgi:hypothetical protein
MQETEVRLTVNGAERIVTSGGSVTGGASIGGPVGADGT